MEHEKDATETFATAAPTIALRVAFAGHRKVALGDDVIKDRLRTAFELVGNVALRVAADRPDYVSGGLSNFAALLVGGAPGTDRQAARVWRGLHESGQPLGPIHGVFPYRDEHATDDWKSSNFSALTTRPSELTSEPDARVTDFSIFDRVTVLDGMEAEAEVPSRNAHLDQMRWLVRYGDLIVVVWDGEMPGGPGGTADTVFQALARGVPVLWIDPTVSGPTRLLDPRALFDDLDRGEFVESLASNERETLAPIATIDGLFELLRPYVSPPWKLDSALIATEKIAYESYTARAARFVSHPEPGAWERLWTSAYRLFIGVLGGLSSAQQQHEPSAGNEHLDREYAAADLIANRISARHRSLQLMILGLAVLAVFFGVLPAGKHVPLLRDVSNLKLICVVLEFLILTSIFVMWQQAAGREQHRVWADARAFAERLRGILATWPLGIDVGDKHEASPATWTEWRALDLIRQAGPPAGVMSQERRLEALRCAERDLIAAQEVYHRNNHQRMHHVHANLERIENVLFFTLVAALIAFALWKVLGLFGIVPESGDAWGEALLILSAVIPAIGAAIIAVEAKLDFSGSAVRSALFEKRFEQLKSDLENTLGVEPNHRLSLARGTEIVRDAASLLGTDIEGWRAGSERRRILRMG